MVNRDSARNNKEPVHIRRNVQDYDDPYIIEEQLRDNSVCKRCGDIYMSGRWYPKDYPLENKNISLHSTVCPACRKELDRVPGGVVKITGDFFKEHKDEVMNLIHNEASRAQSDNPLERLLNIESHDDEVEITTTNEKLAQKIGRALFKAYSGNIEYKWSEDNKLARINWHRDL